MLLKLGSICELWWRLLELSGSNPLKQLKRKCGMKQEWLGLAFRAGPGPDDHGTRPGPKAQFFVPIYIYGQNLKTSQRSVVCVCGCVSDLKTLS